MGALILRTIAAARLGWRSPAPLLCLLAKLSAAHRLELATLSFLRCLEARSIAAGLDATIWATAPEARLVRARTAPRPWLLAHTLWLHALLVLRRHLAWQRLPQLVTAAGAGPR